MFQRRGLWDWKPTNWWEIQDIKVIIVLWCPYDPNKHSTQDQRKNKVIQAQRNFVMLSLSPLPCWRLSQCQQCHNVITWFSSVVTNCHWQCHNVTLEDFTRFSQCHFLNFNTKVAIKEIFETRTASMVGGKSFYFASHLFSFTGSVMLNSLDLFELRWSQSWWISWTQGQGSEMGLEHPGGKSSPHPTLPWFEFALSFLTSYPDDLTITKDIGNATHLHKKR